MLTGTHMAAGAKAEATKPAEGSNWVQGVHGNAVPSLLFVPSFVSVTGGYLFSRSSDDNTEFFLMCTNNSSL